VGKARLSFPPTGAVQVYQPTITDISNCSLLGQRRVGPVIASIGKLIIARDPAESMQSLVCLASRGSHQLSNHLIVNKEDHPCCCPLEEVVLGHTVPSICAPLPQNFVMIARQAMFHQACSVQFPTDAGKMGKALVLCRTLPAMLLQQQRAVKVNLAGCVGLREPEACLCGQATFRWVGMERCGICPALMVSD